MTAQWFLFDQMSTGPRNHKLKSHLRFGHHEANNALRPRQHHKPPEPHQPQARIKAARIASLVLQCCGLPHCTLTAIRSTLRSKAMNAMSDLFSFAMRDFNAGYLNIMPPLPRGADAGADASNAPSASAPEQEDDDDVADRAWSFGMNPATMPLHLLKVSLPSNPNR